MSDTNNSVTNNGRDPKTGQFVKGYEGGPGRQRGSRAKLGEAFLADLHSEWERSGAEALRKCAETEPTAFVKLVGSLLPAKIDQTLKVDVSLFESCQNFHQAYELAQKVISGEIDNNTLWIEAEPEANGD